MPLVIGHLNVLSTGSEIVTMPWQMSHVARCGPRCIVGTWKRLIYVPKGITVG
jgi:hypothetical protein